MGRFVTDGDGPPCIAAVVRLTVPSRSCLRLLVQSIALKLWLHTTVAVAVNS